MLEILVASLHHVLAFTVFAALVIEHLLFGAELTHREARRLQILDMVYGLAVVALIAVGLVRVSFFGPGTAAYLGSAAFWTKMSLFGAVGILSAYPTMRFMSWTAVIKQGTAPEITARDAKLIPWLIRLELLGIVGIIISAVTMAETLPA